MGAASCGTNYGVNKNSPGNGNGKWQGLWPSVGHAKNTRVINTRAGGDNRNVVFYMNQLGGVGRISKMFATTADGVNGPRPKPWWYNNQAIIAAVALLNNFIQTQTNNDAWLGLIGDHETIQSDYINTASGYTAPPSSGYEQWLFEPFIGSNMAQTAPHNVMAAAALLNSMQIRAWVNGKYMVHEVGIIGTSVPASTPNHGINLRLAKNSSGNLVIAIFGDKCEDGDNACLGTRYTSAPFLGIGCANDCSVCSSCSTGYCDFDILKSTGAGVNYCACTNCI